MCPDSCRVCGNISSVITIKRSAHMSHLTSRWTLASGIRNVRHSPSPIPDSYEPPDDWTLSHDFMLRASSVKTIKYFTVVRAYRNEALYTPRNEKRTRQANTHEVVPHTSSHGATEDGCRTPTVKVRRRSASTRQVVPSPAGTGGGGRRGLRRGRTSWRQPTTTSVGRSRCRPRASTQGARPA